MTILCRLLFVFTYAVWQGGFLFYTAAVVPIGTEVLGSATAQGFITRLVTLQINVCGAVSLAIWLPIILWEGGGRPGLRRVMLVGWGLIAACQAGLFVLHPQLDALLDPSQHAVLDPERFYALHRVYLWTISMQWGIALVVLAAMVWVWSSGNSPRPRDETGSEVPRSSVAG